jgi:hypothetical protein
VLRTPLPELLPPFARNQPVVPVSRTPHIVALDIWLVCFGVGAPLADLAGDSLGAELGETRLDRAKDFWRKIPCRFSLGPSPLERLTYLGRLT